VSWIQDVFGANPAVKLLIDPSTGRILEANDAAAEFYGWSVASLAGMSIQDINTATDVEIRAEMAAAAAGARTYFRFTHRRATGDTRRVEVFTGLVQVEGRACLLSIVHDVTERERALEELSRAESRQRALVAQAPVGVAVHRENRFILVNAEFARIVGRSVESLIGSDVLDVISSGERESARADIARLATGVGPKSLVRRDLVRPDGRRVPTDIRAIPFEQDGEPCVLAMVVDVSEREQLEEELRRAQRMDAVGRLAGGVAHDFNNLLAVITSAVELIDSRPGDATTLHTNLDRIRASAQRATELTRQLLQVARGDEATRIRVDVAAAARAIASIVESSLAPGVRLELDLEPETFVLMPPSEVDQIVLNLLVNARDATKAGGQIILSVRRFTVDFALWSEVRLPPGEYVRIQVRDTGEGMRPEVLRSAFEPFFTTKQSGSGTGLGLATVYGIVRRVGGRVHLDSEPGRGTTARAYVPLAVGVRSAASSPSIPAEPSPGPGPQGVVLLVDDHRQVRDVLRHILEDEGYRVVAAASPAEALEQFDGLRGAIGLLLTDVVMPGMRGPELAAELRARAPGLPVLFMSAYAGGSLRAAGLEGEQVLEKPFPAGVLLSRVAALMRGGSPRSAGSTKDA
jgi:PAS domain S-box-containing protein